MVAITPPWSGEASSALRRAQMIDAQVVAFRLVAATLTLTPGADTMLVVRNVLRGWSARRGRHDRGHLFGPLHARHPLGPGGVGAAAAFCDRLSRSQTRWGGVPGVAALPRPRMTCRLMGLMQGQGPPLCCGYCLEHTDVDCQPVQAHDNLGCSSERLGARITYVDVDGTRRSRLCPAQYRCYP
jgi:hypothetical protein